MALQFSVECTPRPAGTKPNSLRRDGKIPATIYGHDGTTSVQVLVDAKAASFLVRDAIVRKSQIEVSVPEMSWTTGAVLQEVQKHPWKGYLYHLSFFAAKG